MATRVAGPAPQARLSSHRGCTACTGRRGRPARSVPDVQQSSRSTRSLGARHAAIVSVDPLARCPTCSNRLGRPARSLPDVQQSSRSTRSLGARRAAIVSVDPRACCPTCSHRLDRPARALPDVQQSSRSSRSANARRASRTQLDLHDCSHPRTIGPGRPTRVVPNVHPRGRSTRSAGGRCATSEHIDQQCGGTNCTSAKPRTSSDARARLGINPRAPTTTEAHAEISARSHADHSPHDPAARCTLQGRVRAARARGCAAAGELRCCDPRGDRLADARALPRLVHRSQPRRLPQRPALHGPAQRQQGAALRAARAPEHRASIHAAPDAALHDAGVAALLQGARPADAGAALAGDHPRAGPERGRSPSYSSPIPRRSPASRRSCRASR
jgi:hypothetical protein